MENKSYEKLIFTQSWDDIKWTIIVLCIFFSIPIIKAKNLYERLTFTVALIFVCFLLIVIFSIIGIRRIEFHKNKIIIEFPGKNIRVLEKDSIKSITIKYEPGYSLLGRFRPGKTVFVIYSNKDLNYLFIRKKLVINSNLFSDKALGENTLKVVNFLRIHYKEIIIDKFLEKKISENIENI
ncbi:MAG: hypothetical protein ACK4YF_08060 [Exilispira sp.]